MDDHTTLLRNFMVLLTVTELHVHRHDDRLQEHAYVSQVDVSAIEHNSFLQSPNHQLKASLWPHAQQDE